MLAAGLAEVARSAGVLLWECVRLVVTLFLRAKPSPRPSVSAQSRHGAYGRFFHAMLDRGVYPPPSQFEAWFLSAAHTERDVAATIKAAHDAMRALA
jgi:glutamate-1-semialdehyde 2,1-aminomutase